MDAVVGAKPKQRRRPGSAGILPASHYHVKSPPTGLFSLTPCFSGVYTATRSRSVPRPNLDIHEPYNAERHTHWATNKYHLANRQTSPPLRLPDLCASVTPWF
jgi:hypothetical protein